MVLFTRPMVCAIIIITHLLIQFNFLVKKYREFLSFLNCDKRSDDYRKEYPIKERRERSHLFGVPYILPYYSIQI